MIARAIAPERIIGCIAYPAAEITAPGRIRHIEGTRFPIGELDGSTTDRTSALSETLQRAGFKAPVLENIRSEIWLKAWGNLSFNPISALTHATLVDICRFPPSRELAARMMTEAQEVATRLDISFRVPLEKRIAGAERVGKHKTSMLQDAEAGKALETEAIIGAVAELGRLTGTPTPSIDAVHALTRLLGHVIEMGSGWGQGRAAHPAASSGPECRKGRRRRGLNRATRVAAGVEPGRPAGRGFRATRLPVESCPFESCPFELCPVEPCPFESCPFESCPFESCPFESCPFESARSSRPVRVGPFESCPFESARSSHARSSRPVRVGPFESCPFESCPFESCPFESRGSIPAAGTSLAPAFRRSFAPGAACTWSGVHTERHAHGAACTWSA